MSTRVTGTDLHQWSSRRTAQGELPAVVRQLIMATVEPTRILFPADEAVARPGLDGVLTVSGEAGPYVPAGDSAWEAGTNGDPRTKAAGDYVKRVMRTSVEERAALTFVFVTSRSWPGAVRWVEDTKELGDGWKDIRAIEAEDLATWLSVCPGVEAGLAGDLNRPYGIVSLRRWFVRWSEYTEPATPAELPLAGRREDAIGLLNALDGSPAAVELCAGSVEEVVAFVAATLLLGAGPDSRERHGEIVTPADSHEIDSVGYLDGDGTATTHSRSREPAELEALLARAVVVETPEAWSRWCQHHRAQVFIPLFYPDNVTEAVAAGHHVILPRVARGANEANRLTPISVEAARTAWSAAGIDLRSADDYARASRRNLKSLRRRSARHRRHRSPEWSSGTSAPLLATALLAGSWHSKFEGDVEVILALTDRKQLRSLNRDLVPLTSGDDPPLSELGNHWKIVDAIDAWDALSGHLAAEDLELFMELVIPVLTEVDPAKHLTGVERVARSLDPDRPRRRYSGELRDGMATTLAILGAVIGDSRLAGDLTGAIIANSAVRDLLQDADEDGWLAVSSHLPALAEAAPERFLDAVEKSLRDENPAVMSLFRETDDGFGGQRTYHSPLLWSLETLSFSRPHLARVASLLAKLTELDPGGRLTNRPAESLVSMLHLRTPQGAINAANRLTLIDTIRRVSPSASSAIMARLVTNAAQGMLIRTGPRYRNWPTPRTYAKYDEVVVATEAIAERLIEDTVAGNDHDKWSLVVELLGHLTAQGRTKVIESISENWEAISPAGQTQITKSIAWVAERNRKYPDAAWAMSAEGVAELDAFLLHHGNTTDQRGSLFGWMPLDIDLSTEEGRDELERQRMTVVREVLPRGLPALLEFAHNVELPFCLGQAVANVTADLDDAIIDLIDSNDVGNRQVAAGLVTVRSRTEGWLQQQTAARPTRSADLVLPLQATNNLLDLVESFDPEQLARFWKLADSVRVADDAVERFVDGILSAGRLFAALDAVSLRHEHVDPSFIQKVLKAPTERESTDDIGALRSAQYEVGQLLDSLEEAGVPVRDLADLEWHYLSLLTHERLPRALHQRLASEPSFFAEVVSHMYKPDPPEEGAGEVADDSEDQYQFSEACLRLVHDWHDPLPGSVRGLIPDPEVMREWIIKVREELAGRNRAGIASPAIGDALAGYTTDDDGTWPCKAVRVVLELEQDDNLENQLAIARLNQRGATIRGAYDGGAQERALAEKYRKGANEIRDEWPRAGRVLDQIVAWYEADARREDAIAEKQVRR